MKTIKCPAGKFTKIISNFGRGYPQDFEITITSEKGETISGVYFENRYFWIFPQTPIEGKLEPKMLFHRQWINGIYSVEIKPDIDVVVTRR